MPTSADPRFPRSLAAAAAAAYAPSRRAPTVSPAMWSHDDRQDTEDAITRCKAAVDRMISELADVAPTLDDCGAAFDLAAFGAAVRDAFNELAEPYDMACERFDEDRAGEAGPTARRPSWEGEH